MAALSAISSLGVVGSLRCVERCWPRTWQARLSGTPSSAITCSTQARRRAGLEVSLGSLGQNELVESEIRDRPSEPGILRLELLQPLHLIALQTAILGAPAIVGDFRHPDRSDRLRHRPTLRRQHIHLAQLGDNLLSAVSLSRHPRVLHPAQSHTSRRTTSKGAAQFFGDILDKIYSNIGPVQRDKLKRSIKAAYDGVLPGEQPTLYGVNSAYLATVDGKPD